MALDLYDPNWFCYPEQAEQTVELTLQQWEHTRIIKIDLDGSVQGFEAISCAVLTAYEDLPVNQQGNAKLILTSPEGNILSCEDEEGVGEDWLKHMIVKAEITSAGQASTNQ